MASKRSRLLQANSKAIQKSKEKEESIALPASGNLVDDTIAELDKDQVTKDIKELNDATSSKKVQKPVEKKQAMKSSTKATEEPISSKEENAEGIHVVLSTSDSMATRPRKKNKKSNYVGIRITDKAMAAINALVELNGEESQNWVLNKHFEDLADQLNVTWERK